MARINAMSRNISRQRSTRPVQRPVIEDATLTTDFVEEVDVAIIARVITTEQRRFDNENFDALLDVTNVLFGEVNEAIFNELIRLRGNLVIGNTYLILFRMDGYGHLSLIARNGAAISVDSVYFYQFKDILNQRQERLIQ